VNALDDFVAIFENFSYNFKSSIFSVFLYQKYRDVLIISIADFVASFTAGITIFAVLGNLHEGNATAIDIDSKTAGAGIAFGKLKMAAVGNFFVLKSLKIIFHVFQLNIQSCLTNLDHHHCHM